MQNNSRAKPKTCVKIGTLQVLVETNPTVSTRVLATRIETDLTIILHHLSENGMAKKKWLCEYRTNKVSKITWIA